jgi:peptide/nickel transport system substrate-binding protein
MKKITTLLLVVFCSLMFFPQAIAIGQTIAADVPREETLIIDQITRYSYPNNYNLWVATVPNHIRQTFMFDTLWYVDQLTGEWINSLAEDKPIYNEDCSQMTVKLREGIFWSDGIELTADDLVFTVEYLLKNAGMRWSAELGQYVEKVYKVDDYTVNFELKKPNPRFHYIFTVRFDGLYMMPKHYWENVADPLTDNFYPPISLGAYVLKNADPSGYWTLYERREDWQRTSAGIATSKPGPEYIMSVFLQYVYC